MLSIIGFTYSLCADDAILVSLIAITFNFSFKDSKKKLKLSKRRFKELMLRWKKENALIENGWKMNYHNIYSQAQKENHFHVQKVSLYEKRLGDLH